MRQSEVWAIDFTGGNGHVEAVSVMTLLLQTTGVYCALFVLICCDIGTLVSSTVIFVFFHCKTNIILLMILSLVLRMTPPPLG